MFGERSRVCHSIKLELATEIRISGVTTCNQHSLLMDGGTIVCLRCLSVVSHLPHNLVNVAQVPRAMKVFTLSSCMHFHLLLGQGTFLQVCRKYTLLRARAPELWGVLQKHRDRTTSLRQRMHMLTYPLSCEWLTVS